MVIRTRRGAGGVLVAFFLSALLALPAAAGSRAFVHVPGMARAEIEKVLAGTGARLLVFLPEAESALVEGDAEALARIPGVDLQATGPLDEADLSRLPETALPAARAWNELVAARRQPLAERPDGAPLDRDALAGPDWWDLEVPTRHGALSSSGTTRPWGASWENTSEYLAGSVSLNVVLVESDGSIDPNREDWTEALETKVAAEALEAVTGLADLHPGAGLSFTLHLRSGRTDAAYRTSYEPIARKADPSGTTGEDLWTKEILGHLGYADGSRLARSRLWADDTRVADGTDWAVNVFVVNSENDADGKFADGYFAYAWIGGPHVVVTTDNDGWGIDRFDRVLRHELHHSFFALDEYASSGCACGDTSGYLAGTNDNCENGCGGADPCVMRDNALAACEETRVQVGTVDRDGDGTPDLLQAPPTVTLEDRSGVLACQGIAKVGGTVEVGLVPNNNPWNVTPRNSISILRTVDVEVRVDGGEWASGVALADDGAFDGPQEGWGIELALPSGRHVIEVRGVDSRGNRSAVRTVAVDVSQPTAPVGPTLRVTLTANGTTLTWDPASGAATYRIRRASRAADVDGAEPVMETAVTSWSDTAPGTVFYRVSAVDGCGNEEP